MTREGVSRLLGRIKATYLRQIPEEAIGTWLDALSDLSDDLAFRALTAHLKDSDRPPTPASILRSASTIQAEIIPEESIPDRLKRLNEQESRRISARLRTGDAGEIRFQKFMLRKALIEGWFEQDEHLFRRILGRDVVQEELEAYYGPAGMAADR
jgi:hypothetical protein